MVVCYKDRDHQLASDSRGCSGTDIVTDVPSPGRLSRTNLPPSIVVRSRIPIRPNVLRLAIARDIDPCTIVLDAQRDLGIGPAEGYVDLTSLCMPGNIGQRLLQHTENSGGNLRFEIEVRSRDVDRDAIPVRWRKSFVSHSMVARGPRSSSIRGRSSVAIRRTDATVLSSSDFIACARLDRLRLSRLQLRDDSARSILRPVNAWPSSSWSSRAMRVFSSSRTACNAAESSRNCACDSRSSCSARLR